MFPLTYQRYMAEFNNKIEYLGKCNCIIKRDCRWGVKALFNLKMLFLIIIYNSEPFHMTTKLRIYGMKHNVISAHYLYISDRKYQPFHLVEREDHDNRRLVNNILKTGRWYVLKKFFEVWIVWNSSVVLFFTVEIMYCDYSHL